MANFVLKLSHYRYCDVNFNVAVKLPDLKNPLFGARLVYLLYYPTYDYFFH